MFSKRRSCNLIKSSKGQRLIIPGWSSILCIRSVDMRLLIVIYVKAQSSIRLKPNKHETVISHDKRRTGSEKNQKDAP